MKSFGASVVINYGRDEQAAIAAVDILGGYSKAHAVQADAGSVTGVEKIVKDTVDKFGRLDIVVANAGVLPMSGVASTTESDFDQTFALNVKGPYFLVQKAIPHMSSGSSIVLVSSSQCHASTVTGPYTLYCATKGAIEQMVRTMSKDLSPKGINVNAVAPGPTGTDLFFKGKTQEMIDRLASMNPKNRIGTPEEIANAVVFLALPASIWVSGQVMLVNGGQV
jgi:3-oxoacyl-[acyl-carrier protein] reductase